MKKLIVILLIATASVNAFAQAGLKAGDKAPEFAGIDNNGKSIKLRALLKSHKAVVLFFYRGQWCPYCNKQIKHLQDSLQLLTSKGAYVIGVTPETSENINKTIEKTHASFSMLYDRGYSIMKAYDVNYVMDPAMYANYKANGVDLEKNNGNADHVLPVPATYVINRDGKIAFVQFDKDYRKRPSIAKILKQL